MPEEGARNTSEAYVVSKLPDFCKSPGAPVAYQIVGKFDNVIRTATTVNMTSTESFNALSRVVMVVGDESGVGGGVASAINKGFCKPTTWSSTVRTEGNWAVMHDVEMEMNCAGPDGAGNTIGKLVYVKCTAAAVVTPSGEIEVDKKEEAPPSEEDSATEASSEEAADSEPSPEEQAALDQEAAELQQEIDQIEQEAAEAEAELAKHEAEAAKINAEMALDALQAGVDLIGIGDPTPTSDAISMGISLGRGDYFGAILSGVSMVPYLGDAVAKPIKAARASKAAAKLAAAYKRVKALANKAAQKLAKLKDKAKKLKEKAKEALEKLHKDERGVIGPGGGKKGKGGDGDVRVSSDRGGKGGGNGKKRAKNKLERDPKAQDDHSTFDRDKDGNVYKYETYNKTESGHFDPRKRFDGGKPDGSPGAPHVNKQTQESIPTPHVQGKDIPGGVRRPELEEIPSNPRF